MDHAYLIAEDDENTQLLILRAYKMLDLVFPDHSVNNGQKQSISGRRRRVFRSPAFSSTCAYYFGFENALHERSRSFAMDSPIKIQGNGRGDVFQFRIGRLPR